MIHLVSFVKAKPGMSREAFREHWRERHAPLLLSIPEDRRHTAYYGQYTRVDSDYDRPGSPGYDGVAVQSFESMEDVEAFIAELQKVGTDAPEFMDLTDSPWILTSDPLVVVGERP
ncbi:MAG TPA: EthD domain-containing protein [Acidimicrobiales bacterium]|nr:EthD domain-containing protein [Acidimicrobiales bacterium]